MENTVQNDIVDQINDAYLEYAMSVIVGRALPDVRDGFKPVHRRILYAMHDLNNRYNQPYKKSARVVGDVIGKYHPHGDLAVYETLVRMAQDFNLRYPIVQGQGNFGSIDGDRAAAMRYTEVRMSRLAEDVLGDIEKDTVPFMPNYDGSLTEPILMPTTIPNLLVNGSSGIAVGMSTNVPPHNLTEIIDGLIFLIDHPDSTVKELTKIIKGPDFPTAGTIYGLRGIQEAYEKGRGIIQIRAKVESEELKGGKTALVVHEIPYQVNKAALIQKIADLVRDKVIEGISDIRDESSREGLRVVIELRKNELPLLILNKLYKHTQMQVSFGIQILALDGNMPKLFNLKEALNAFISYRHEIITKRSIFDLRKLQERIHILEGLIKAVDNIDAIVALIKKSASPQAAHDALCSKFDFSKIQAKAILDMRLHRLTQLETKNLKIEHTECAEAASFLQKLLSDKQLIYEEAKKEFVQIKEKFGDKRRTKIEAESQEFIEEDLLTDEDMVITISHRGYIKRHPVSEYRAQRRGGRGIRGAGIQADDFIRDLFVAGNHNVLLCFSDLGRLYWLKVYRVPEGAKGARGRPVVNLLNIQSHEKIVSIVPINGFEPEKYVLMATKKGVIKKCILSDFQNIRSSGIVAIKCDKGDELIDAKLIDNSHDVLLISQKGQSIRFPSSQARQMGRAARGVIGMRLDSDDQIIDMAIPESETSMLTMTSRGYGKRTLESEYRTQNRGGSGIIAMKTNEKIGNIIGCIQVNIEDDVMIVTTRGQMIRIRIKDVSQIGRNTQGVRMINLKEDERAVSFALCDESDESNSHEESS